MLLVFLFYFFICLPEEVCPFWNGGHPCFGGYFRLYPVGKARGLLTLSLFMALVLGADNHYFAVSFNNFALVAHRFYRRSNFHFNISFWNSFML